MGTFRTAIGSLLLFCGSALALGPETFAGRPGYTPGSEVAAFVWAEDVRVHVCVTAPSPPRTFGGQVDAMHFDGLQTRDIEKDDVVGLTSEAVLHFQLQVGGDHDCFSAQAAGPGVRFRLTLDGLPLAPERIFLGAGRTTPRTNPFSLNR